MAIHGSEALNIRQLAKRLEDGTTTSNDVEYLKSLADAIDDDNRDVRKAAQQGNSKRSGPIIDYSDY